MRLPTEDLSDTERKILADVDQHGLHVAAILEDDDGPSYSFSVGLWHSFAHPEVVVFGLPAEVAHDLINLIADEISAGRKFDAGAEATDLLQGYVARFLNVAQDRHRDYFGTARWAYEGDGFRVVQLVYPDKQGRWPWLEDTAVGFRKIQPVLGERPDATAADDGRA